MVDDDSVPIVREARATPRLDGRYIDPPLYVVVAGDNITPQDRVLTAVCWTVGKRPADIQVHSPTPTPEESETLPRAIGNLHSDHAMTFLGMAGVLVLAKEVRKLQPGANVEYLLQRWKALCATSGVENIWAGGVTDRRVDWMINLLVSWQTWIRPHSKLRWRLLKYALANKEENPLIKGDIDQIKLVLNGYGLKSLHVMEGFATVGSRAIFLLAIAKQAWELKKVLEDLRRQHGELYPYMRVFPLEEVDRAHHRNFPDLYYASVRLAQKNKELGPEGRYVMTDVITTISKSLIDDQVTMTYRIKPQLDEITKNYLKEIGVDPEQATRRRRGDDEDEDETDRDRTRRRL